LVFALQYKNIGYSAKRNTEVDNFSLCDIGRDVSDVDDPRGGIERALFCVELNPFGLIVIETIVAIWKKNIVALRNTFNFDKRVY